ncbi:MAG: hypothetical protein FJ245_13075 [Nitrospira sp.]|nr:hypothetical protein [Nitrospira sp.]
MADSVGRIDYGEYAGSLPVLKHVYLVGDLQRSVPHPFVRDGRAEFAVCQYEAGDDGEFHWHRQLSEYEIVTEGKIGYIEAASGRIHWFHAGDVSIIPAGVCVKRLVRQPARTVVMKVPSANDKVHCGSCPRECRSRVHPYEAPPCT